MWRSDNGDFFMRECGLGISFCRSFSDYFSCSALSTARKQTHQLWHTVYSYRLNTPFWVTQFCNIRRKQTHLPVNLLGCHFTISNKCRVFSLYRHFMWLWAFNYVKPSRNLIDKNISVNEYVDKPTYVGIISQINRRK